MKRKEGPSRQRGAATLIVVMVIFFLVSLVAAYTSRNMIFEQRTSANQYRSTQALEAAEAGLEWALTHLNFGRINGSCTAGSATDTSFRQRYLDINASTGTILPRVITPVPISPLSPELTPQCVFNPEARIDSITGVALAANSWSCSCPMNAAPILSAPTSATAAPAFRVRFIRIGNPTLPPLSQPGVVRVEVVACTRLDPGCLDFTGQGQVSEGRAVVSSLIALTGTVATMPLAGLTAQVNVSAPAVVENTVPAGTGITIQAGGTIGATARANARTIAGTPSSASLIEDPALNPPAATPPPPTSSDRMFISVFNMFPESFRQQQGGVQQACGVAGCSAAAIRTLAGLNPGRPLWLAGNLNIDSSGPLGSVTEPVLMVVNGDVVFSTSGVTIYGLVYVRQPLPAMGWTVINSGQVTGAVVSEGSVGGTGIPTVVYSEETLRRLRANTGTFVRVPSSWRDYQ